MSSSLDPDQAQHFVGSGLGLKCLILNTILAFAFALCFLSKASHLVLFKLSCLCEVNVKVYFMCLYNTECCQGCHICAA